MRFAAERSTALAGPPTLDCAREFYRYSSVTPGRSVRGVYRYGAARLRRVLQESLRATPYVFV